MMKHNQNGAVSGLGVSLGLTIFFLVLTIGFAGWAFMSRQDYKDNVDAKISDAVKIGKQEEASAKEKEFVEREKNPLREYNGPAPYGSIKFLYPKTWSAYIVQSDQEDALIDGYFNPGIVPSVDSPGTAFALRIQVLNQPYAEVLEELTPELDEGQTRTVSAYALPKVPKVVGVKIVGALNESRSGTMIVLPLRSQTLQIFTEGDQFANDFNNIIIPNFIFSP